MKAVRCFIGLGSNLDEPLQQLHKAIAALQDDDEFGFQRRSSFYRSRAIGPGKQPDYCNAVAELSTTLSAIELLDRLQALEQAQGRARDPAQRWTPRTLDLDILLFGDQHISEPRLQVPHPEMFNRNFVLYPLAEIAPDLRLGEKGAASECARMLGDDGLEPWA